MLKKPELWARRWWSSRSGAMMRQGERRGRAEAVWQQSKVKQSRKILLITCIGISRVGAANISCIVNLV